MKEWNKGEIKFACIKCDKVVAKESGEIRQGETAVLFIVCNDCVKKGGLHGFSTKP